MTKITNEDIEFWEKHLNSNQRDGVREFSEHLLKLAKAIKELQND